MFDGDSMGCSLKPFPALSGYLTRLFALCPSSETPRLFLFLLFHFGFANTSHFLHRIPFSIFMFAPPSISLLLRVDSVLLILVLQTCQLFCISLLSRVLLCEQASHSQPIAPSYRRLIDRISFVLRGGASRNHNNNNMFRPDFHSG